MRRKMLALRNLRAVAVTPHLGAVLMRRFCGVAVPAHASEQVLGLVLHLGHPEGRLRYNTSGSGGGIWK